MWPEKATSEWRHEMSYKQLQPQKKTRWAILLVVKESKKRHYSKVGFALFHHLYGWWAKNGTYNTWNKAGVNNFFFHVGARSCFVIHFPGRPRPWAHLYALLTGQDEIGCTETGKEETGEVTASSSASQLQLIGILRVAATTISSSFVAPPHSFLSLGRALVALNVPRQLVNPSSEWLPSFFRTVASRWIKHLF